MTSLSQSGPLYTMAKGHDHAVVRALEIHLKIESEFLGGLKIESTFPLFGQ